MECQNEIWKAVVGHEEAYEVSSIGRVRSLDRKITHAGYNPRFVYGRMLRPNIGKQGYYSVIITPPRKRMRINRLVAIAFLPNPENKKEVNHINGIKSDNRVENLEWCTSSENKIHGHKIGILKSNVLAYATGRRNELHYASKPIHQIDMATGDIIKTWPSTSEAGRNGFGGPNIANVANGRLKHAYGYYWKYKTA